MGAALAHRLPQVHGLVMAAAVADHSPGVTNAMKWPKDALPNPLPLQGTPDLAADLAARMRGDQWVLGFAAEHELDRARALEKLRRKGLDWIVLNPIGLAGRGFGNRPNGGVLLRADGEEQRLACQDKITMAGAIWSAFGRGSPPVSTIRAPAQPDVKDLQGSPATLLLWRCRERLPVS